MLDSPTCEAGDDTDGTISGRIGNKRYRPKRKGLGLYSLDMDF